jgi:hypothetical protein
MTHKTTVTLPDDLHTQWKASGQSLAEVIRRGLDGTGDTARHTATESRLAGIETRLARLETAGRHPGGQADASVTTADDPAELEEMERRWEEERQQGIANRRELLLTKVKRLPGSPCIVTVNLAAGILGFSTTTAKRYMFELVEAGWARQLDRPNGGPYEWEVFAQAPATAATTAP